MMRWSPACLRNTCVAFDITLKLELAETGWYGGSKELPHSFCKPLQVVQCEDASDEYP
jgi:hypothetical protein